MSEADGFDSIGSDGVTAPLRYPVYRRIWIASLISNLGILIQGVGASWAMTEMASSADKVALVQTALLLPFMLFSMPAGAIADMLDRRIVTLVSLCISLAAGVVITALALCNILTPASLLVLCFVVGTGMALMVPAWQASLSEQLPPAAVPGAVALSGISYNIARCIGPAIGGLVVATAGFVTAFALNAIFYLPLIRAVWLWKRVPEPPSFPPESFGRAIVSGVRYIIHSPSITVLMVRSMVMGVIGAAVIALMPLVARDRLAGGPGTYGIILSAFGIGAVIGALSLARVRQRTNEEQAMRICTLSMGAAILIVALSSRVVVTVCALVVAGAVWMVAWNLFSIGVQLAVPKWVAGRTLAAYQAAGTGGIAVGSWGWGHLTDSVGAEMALMVAAGLMVSSACLGFWFAMPSIDTGGEEGEMLQHPVTKLPLTMRSGPVVIEIEYRISPSNFRAFSKVAQKVCQFRQRNGAYGWSLACDISDPELWTERFCCPTWLDYLRQRNRSTKPERALDEQLATFHIGPGPVKARRMLERPIVSFTGEDDALNLVSGDQYCR